MLEVPWDLHLESCVWNIEKKEKKDDKQLSQENDLQKLVQLHVQERDVTVKEKILLKEKRKEDRDIMLRKEKKSNERPAPGMRFQASFTG